MIMHVQKTNKVYNVQIGDCIKKTKIMYTEQKNHHKTQQKTHPTNLCKHPTFETFKKK